MKKTKVLAATLVLFASWSSGANAQLGGLLSETLQNVTGQSELSVGLPGVAEVVMGGSDGTGAGLGLSVLGGGDSNSTNVGGLGTLTVDLPQTGPQGGAPNDQPETDHPGWVGGDPTMSPGDSGSGGGGGGGSTSFGGGGNNGTQLALGTAPRNGLGGGAPGLIGNDGQIAAGQGSSRLRTLVRVMEDRAWYGLADGNSLCLYNFGAASVTGWLRQRDLQMLGDVVDHYRSDIAQLQKMISNCRANRSVISRNDIKRIIGIDIRNGQAVLFML